jgi:hypothetical protein
MERPDAEGWRFKAIARGAGDLTFSGSAPPDRGDQPNPVATENAVCVATIDA